MIFLWIFLALLAILLLAVLLVLMLRIKIVIYGNNEDIVKLRFYLYGFRIFSFSAKQKDEPPKVKLSDYTPEKLSKRKKKERPKSVSQRLRDVATNEAKGKPDIVYILKFILNLLRTFAQHYAKKFKVKILKFNISVATGDAASTAILYGTVSQAASYLIEFLDNNTALTVPRTAKINVASDFCGDETQIDIKMEVFIHLRRVLSLLYRSGLRSPADIKNFFK